MQNINRILLCSILLLVMNLASAGDDSLDYFNHNDWALTCDNTRTCFAEGYQCESGDLCQSEPISMLVSRVAGKNSMVDIAVQVREPDDGVEYKFGKVWHFKVGEITLLPNVDVQSAGWSLNKQQVMQVLPQLLKQSSAILTDGKTTWELSLNGAKAVLLKMDEKQGRLSTSSALVKRGDRNKSQVLSPLEKPTIYAVAPAKTLASDEKLKPLIFDELGLNNEDSGYNCNNHTKDVKALDIGISRLTKSKVLLSYSCVAGAYNSTGLLWIANDKPPYQPQLQKADGDYAGGEVNGAWKGRGIGDCWSTKTWVFDGKGFALTQSSDYTMCRRFAGGAWSIKQFVSNVVTKK